MSDIVQRPSPNCSQRPPSARITAVIVHADAGTTEEGTLSWICTKHPNPKDNVSYHYLIGRDGTIYQCVADAMKAWHAGLSTFRGQADCNTYSLGVSFANNQQGEPFPADQVIAGAELVALLCLRHEVPVDRITTHAKVSPGRKRDPGDLFPWSAFLSHVKAELDA
jgi:N-acetylmuramoyl-L-alanine amidase